MMGRFLTVDVHIRHLVSGTDVQQHPSLAEIFRKTYLPAVPKGHALREMLLHPGKLGFRTEGYPDGTVKGLGAGFPGGKVPGAVQVQPAASAQLGTGISIPGGSGKVFTPGGSQFLQHNDPPQSRSFISRNTNASTSQMATAARKAAR